MWLEHRFKEERRAKWKGKKSVGKCCPFREVTFSEDVSLCRVWQARVHKFHLHKGGILFYHDILAQVSLDPKVAFVSPTSPTLDIGPPVEFPGIQYGWRLGC